jgi:hypothetical protein
MFDLPETYPVNGNPTSVAQMVGQYYKAILLPFEEYTRKNAQQQRPVLGVQGQAGQSQQVGQHSVPSQMSGGDVGAQGVIPPTIPHVDGGSTLPPHHPFTSSQTQTHRRPSVGLNMLPTGSSLQSPDVMSGIGSSIPQPFLAQTSPDGPQLGLQGQAQDGVLPFDADAESRKRKGASEVDVKRVRQRTGMWLNSFM